MSYHQCFNPTKHVFSWASDFVSKGAIPYCLPAIAQAVRVVYPRATPEEIDKITKKYQAVTKEVYGEWLWWGAPDTLVNRRIRRDSLRILANMSEMSVDSLFPVGKEG